MTSAALDYEMQIPHLLSKLSEGYMAGGSVSFVLSGHPAARYEDSNPSKAPSTVAAFNR